MVMPGETIIVTGGLNNVFYMNKLGPEGETIIFTVTYTFEGKRVTIKVDSSMGYFSSLQATGEIIE
jgi:hypothetical protein